MVRIKRVKRIAVAVKDLDAAVKNWQKLFGMRPFQKGEEPEDKYAFVAFHVADHTGEDVTTIEFLSPINDPNGEMLLGKFIKNHGEGLYMVTLETQGTSDEVDEELKKTGLKGSWGGQLKHWETTKGGIKSWTEHYISPVNANGVLVTLASIVYATEVLTSPPGITIRNK